MLVQVIDLALTKNRFYFRSQKLSLLQSKLPQQQKNLKDHLALRKNHQKKKKGEIKYRIAAKTPVCLE